MYALLGEKSVQQEWREEAQKNSDQISRVDVKWNTAHIQRTCTHILVSFHCEQIVCNTIIAIGSLRYGKFKREIASTYINVSVNSI